MVLLKICAIVLVVLWLLTLIVELAFGALIVIGHTLDEMLTEEERVKLRQECLKTRAEK